MSESLYDRLGGAPAIEAAVALFYKKVLDNPVLAPFFEWVNIKAQRIQQQLFMTAAFGGPDLYRGRDMAEAHAKHAITPGHFDAVAGQPVATLQELGIPSPPPSTRWSRRSPPSRTPSAETRRQRCADSPART